MTHFAKKILLLTTSFRPLIGGSERAIEEVVRRLSDYHFDIITARLNPTWPIEEKMANGTIWRVGDFRHQIGLFLPKIFLPWAIFKQARLLLKNNGPYDLVHVWQASQAAGAAWLLKKTATSLPLLLTWQEGEMLDKQSFLKKWARQVVLKKVDQATAISHYLRQQSHQIKPSLPVVIIPNGVGEEFFRQFSYGEIEQLAQTLGLRPGEKVIITISRLVTKNGVDQLLLAVGQLKSWEIKEWRLLIVGAGSEKDRLLSLSHRLNIENKIIWADRVEPKQIPLWLNLAQVFVRLSRSEGLGSAFLEAMAAGVPVIGPAVGGISDFLQDQETGLLCQPADPSDTAEKIKFLLSNPGVRAKIIKQARALVKAQYTWEKISQQYRKIYEKTSNLKVSGF